MKLWKHTLVSLMATFSVMNANAAPQELDRVSILVNSGVILQSDIESALKTVRLNAQGSAQALPE